MNAARFSQQRGIETNRVRRKDAARISIENCRVTIDHVNPLTTCSSHVIDIVKQGVVLGLYLTDFNEILQGCTFIYVITVCEIIAVYE